MRITDLELANAVIDDQDAQIDRLNNENIRLKKELNNKRSDVYMNGGPIIIHEDGPSISRELYTGSMITRKPKKRWYEFWK